MTQEKYGYAYWAGKPVTPGVHNIVCVPQSIADGWGGFCSCGQWRDFVSIYDLSDAELKNAREATIARLNRLHEAHKHKAAAEEASS